MTIVAGVCFFLFAAEWFFWEEFTSRFNFISVDYLVYRREVTENIYQSYPVILIGIACLLAGVLFTTFYQQKINTKYSLQSFKQRSGITLGLFTLATIFIFGLDQNNRQFTDNRILVEISSNGPYQFFAAFRNNHLDFNAFYATLPEEESRKIFHTANNFPSDAKGLSTRHIIKSSNPEKNLNVIFIVVESLSARFMAHFGNEDGLTPYMDALVEDSLFFSQLYSTGSRTTRGLEALSLSLPPCPGRSLVKRLDQPPRYNIGTEFLNRKYDVSFLYGGNSYFDNMGDFFRSNHFNVIDRQDFVSNDTGFDTAWGLADEYLFEQTLIESDKSYNKGKPFFSLLMTTSNHRPFTFPEGRIDLPPGHRKAVVKYTDWAINNFLEKAKQKPWFDDTVFVLVADHAASSAGRKNLTVTKHHIPLFFYAPKHIQPRKISALMSQIDVAPILMGLLNFNYTSYFVGQDILNEPNYAGRAFIANYQFLGLYESGGLTYLKPKKEIIFDSDPLNSVTEEVITSNDIRAKRAISFYQSTARIISQNLTATSSL